MNLSPEIEHAARVLGQALRDQEATRLYLEARRSVETDSEAVALEKEMYATYEALIARQQAGEQIPRKEVEAFYAIRDRLFSDPLVMERESALKPLKSLFLETAEEISAPLGVDYTNLAKKG